MERRRIRDSPVALRVRAQTGRGVWRQAMEPQGAGCGPPSVRGSPGWARGHPGRLRSVAQELSGELAIRLVCLALPKDWTAGWAQRRPWLTRRLEPELRRELRHRRFQRRVPGLAEIRSVGKRPVRGAGFWRDPWGKEFRRPVSGRLRKCAHGPRVEGLKSRFTEGSETHRLAPEKTEDPEDWVSDGVGESPSQRCAPECQRLISSRRGAPDTEETRSGWGGRCLALEEALRGRSRILARRQLPWRSSGFRGGERSSLARLVSPQTSGPPPLWSGAGAVGDIGGAKRSRGAKTSSGVFVVSGAGDRPLNKFTPLQRPHGFSRIKLLLARFGIRL